jgi:hypothetical protein
MGRVREKKRWRKEKKWRDREEEEETSPPEPSMKVRPLELKKEALNTGQRLKTKVEPAVKFSPPRILSWIRHCSRRQQQTSNQIQKFAVLFFLST